ncbi:MAG: DUF2764 family protein [Spirochaetes bacterium]|nr:DUF2764 family protein [Spirochaetota bacterium]
MSQYYFAVASLPHLTYDLEKLPEIDNFLQICGENLKTKDFKIIKSAVLDALDKKKIKNKTLNNWLVWEKNLRNSLVRLRAGKKNESPDEYLRNNPELFIDDKFIHDAFEDDSPLNAEDILNRERWSFLDALEKGHYFDEVKLFVYYLKLQLLWRKKRINKEEGSRKFNEIVETFSSELNPEK